MRRGVILLGWFFIATYGSVTKADFYTKTACDQGRTDVLTALGGATATNLKRVGPCREDVAPSINATVTGDLTGTFTLPPGVTTK